MENRRFSYDSVTRLIDEYECKRRINGAPFRMSGAELLRIIKINDFESVLKRLKENEETQLKFCELETKILSILNFRDFFEKLMTEITTIFNVPYVWLSVIENSPLADLIHRIKDSELIRQRTNFIKESDFTRFVKSSTRPVLINRYLSPLSVFFPAERNYPLRSIAIAPVTMDGKVVGSLNQGDLTSTRFDPKMDTSLLEQLMRKISLCLSNVAAHELLEFFAFHDPLTGLLNRRSFEKSLQQEFSRATRYNANLSLVFIDLNGLKQINDRYGHEYGDEALKYVGQNLESLCRREDIVARFAGDEFVMILPETSAENAEANMQRIQDHLDSNPLHHRETSLTISLSYGISTLGEQEVASPQELLKLADSRLYVSKGEKSNDTMLTPLTHPRFLRAKAS